MSGPKKLLDQLVQDRLERVDIVELAKHLMDRMGGPAGAANRVMNMLDQTNNANIKCRLMVACMDLFKDVSKGPEAANYGDDLDSIPEGNLEQYLAHLVQDAAD